VKEVKIGPGRVYVMNSCYGPNLNFLGTREHEMLVVFNGWITIWLANLTIRSEDVGHDMIEILFHSDLSV